MNKFIKKLKPSFCIKAAIFVCAHTILISFVYFAWNSHKIAEWRVMGHGELATAFIFKFAVFVGLLSLVIKLLLNALDSLEKAANKVAK